MNHVQLLAACRMVEGLNQLLEFVSDKKNTKILLGELKQAASELQAASSLSQSKWTEAEALIKQAQEMADLAAIQSAAAEKLEADCRARHEAIVASTDALAERERVLKETLLKQSALLAEKIAAATDRENAARVAEQKAQELSGKAEAGRLKYETMVTRLRKEIDHD